MRYIFLLCVSCGWTVGVIGNERDPYQQQKLPDNHCTIDEQCQEGYICLKTNDNYIGLCGQVVNKGTK